MKITPIMAVITIIGTSAVLGIIPSSAFALEEGEYAIFSEGDRLVIFLSVFHDETSSLDEVIYEDEAVTLLHSKIATDGSHGRMLAETISGSLVYIIYDLDESVIKAKEFDGNSKESFVQQDPELITIFS